MAKLKLRGVLYGRIPEFSGGQLWVFARKIQSHWRVTHHGRVIVPSMILKGLCRFHILGAYFAARIFTRLSEERQGQERDWVTLPVEQTTRKGKLPKRWQDDRYSQAIRSLRPALHRKYKFDADLLFRPTLPARSRADPGGIGPQRQTVSSRQIFPQAPRFHTITYRVTTDYE